MSEPLWNNNRMLHKTPYIQNWVDHGVLFVKDLISQDGSIKTFREFKNDFKVKGTFLDYERVLTSIPKEWKERIQTDYDSMQPILPVYIKALLRNDGCRHIYKILSANNTKATAQTKWEVDFAVLGVTFTTNFNEIWLHNFLQKYNAVERMLGSWKKRKLTLLGKITVLKSLAIPKFVHLFMSLPNPPSEMIKKLNTLMFKFLE